MKTILYNPLSSGFMGFIIGISICSTSTLINGSAGYFGSSWPISLGLGITTIWWTVLHAYYEADLIKRGIRPNHPIRAIQRTFAAAVLATIPALYLDNTILNIITGTIYLLSVFGLIFDSLLNEFRGIWNLFYVSDEPKAALSDRMYRKIPGKYRPFAMITVKLIILTAASFAYSKTIN